MFLSNAVVVARGNGTVQMHGHPSCSSSVQPSVPCALQTRYSVKRSGNGRRIRMCRAQWGGSNGDDALLDNVEISDIERREMADRLRKRRLEKRRALRVEEKGAQSRDKKKTMRKSTKSRVERPGNASSSFYGWGEESDVGTREAAVDESWWDEPEQASTPVMDDISEDTVGYDEPPDIVLLSPEELDRVLPVLPFAAQADYFTGGAAQALQRWGASLALTVLFSKAALLAATSLTWPLWWPWARAANKNIGIRSKMEYGGVWRTHVLEVETGSRPRPKFGETEDVPRFMSMKTSRIVVGEELGAQTELVLPYDARFEVLQPGQPAEVLVLSNTTSFDNIKAIKDVYLPDSGLWLSEYPYIDRAEYLEISLDIEKEVQQQYM